MSWVAASSNRMLLKLLQLFCIYAAFILAAAQNMISTTAATSPLPSTVAVGKATTTSTANSVKLTVSPSTTVYSGSPLNFTCTFKTLPYTDKIYFVMINNYLSRTIAQVSTRLMSAMLPIDIRQRMAIYLQNDGVSLLFSYSYTLSSDAGIYRCYVAGDVGSNSVTVTINYGYVQQSTVNTTPQPTTEKVTDSVTTPSPILMPYSEADYDTQSTSSVNIPLVITITLGTACVITACVLFVLRLKYRERFCRTCKTRPQQPPSYVTAQLSGSQHGGMANPVYTVDTEQLPSYVDAIKIANQFMPPSYNEVMTSSSAPCVPSAPMPDQNPASNV